MSFSEGTVKFTMEGQSMTWVPDQKYCEKEADLTIIIEEIHFKVHKSVLEASSDYFRAMFSSGMCENEKDVINIKLLQAAPFQIIVQGIYSRVMEVNEANVFSVVEAAHILQLVPVLFEQCASVLKTLINTQHCFDVMHFSEPLNLVSVYSDVRRYCLANFSTLRHCQAFLDLAPSQMLGYLSDKHLVVRDEFSVCQALQDWFHANRNRCAEEEMMTLATACIRIKDANKNASTVTDMILGEKKLTETDIRTMLDSPRPMQEDILLFWSLLDTTRADGLVDVVKLNQDMGQGVGFDSMEDVVRSPGYDLGSAVCADECSIYLCGGGPSFGKMNWIKKIYKFDVCRDHSRWQIIGDLYETRRHHAMVAVGTKLYIFGGFGKFRAKNVKLDCFDTDNNTFESLPITPTHEIKPHATSSCGYIFYITGTSDAVYCFSVESSQWSSIETMLQPRPVRPIGLFTHKENPKSLMIVLDGMEEVEVVNLQHRGECSTFSQPLWVNESSSSIKKPTDGTSKCTLSVLANGKLSLLLSKEEEEDPTIENENSERTQQHCTRVLTYCTKTNEILNLCETNVQKALNCVAIPYLPDSFSLGSSLKLSFENGFT